MQSEGVDPKVVTASASLLNSFLKGKTLVAVKEGQSYRLKKCKWTPKDMFRLTTYKKECNEKIKEAIKTVADNYEKVDWRVKARLAIAVWKVNDQERQALRDRIVSVGGESGLFDTLRKVTINDISISQRGLFKLS